MRHTLIISEQPAAPSWPKTSTRIHQVSFEYAVRQPVDDLTEAVVTAFIAQDKVALTNALKAFTEAGYNPSAIQIQGDFEYEEYSNLHVSAPRSLLMVALNQQAPKSPKIALMKILVKAGCDPFEPYNFAARAITDENGPSSKGRQQWSWLLDNTPAERWLKASVDEAGQSNKKYSLVHHAIRYGQVPVVEAMVKRLGLDVLKAEGPSLFETLDQYFPLAGSPNAQATHTAMLDALRAPLIALEQAQLRALAEESSEAKPGARARL